MRLRIGTLGLQNAVPGKTRLSGRIVNPSRLSTRSYGVSDQCEIP